VGVRGAGGGGEGYRIFRSFSSSSTGGVFYPISSNTDLPMKRRTPWGGGIFPSLYLSSLSITPTPDSTSLLPLAGILIPNFLYISALSLWTFSFFSSPLNLNWVPTSAKIFLDPLPVLIDWVLPSIRSHLALRDCVRVNDFGRPIVPVEVLSLLAPYFSRKKEVHTFSEFHH
jgi:hypothetical protein